MPKTTEDELTHRVKSKTFIMNNTEDNNEYDNNNYEDENEDEDNDSEENFHLQLIKQIKSVFINHFDLTNRTIAEFVTDNEINKLIYLFTKN